MLEGDGQRKVKISLCPFMRRPQGCRGDGPGGGEGRDAGGEPKET